MLAVIGTGYWGRNLVRNFFELGALSSICDVDRGVLNTLAGQYPGPAVVTDAAHIWADPAIRAVVVATPAETHATLVRQALEAGKDVYVEKPVCLDEAEGRHLVRLADENGRILMVGHLLWYHPAVGELARLIQGGELGRIQYIYSNRLNLGKLRREENVLWSFAPHDVSVILGLLGEMPDTVHAQGGNYLHPQIADVTVSLLTFPSGVRAHIFVSWLHPFKEQKLVVVGDRKMAVFTDTAPWGEKLQLFPHRIEWHGNIPLANKAEAEAVTVSPAEPLRLECRHFLECVETRKRPLTDGEEGLRVLKVLNCCQQSMNSQRPVPLEVRARTDAHFVHPTAIVDEDVSIGEGTRVWHFSHILTGSSIGPECTIGQNVTIGPDVSVGRGCKIQNNVSVYKGVTLEDEVFCGPSTVFTNVYNPRAAIRKMDELRPTLVRKGATLGANCTVVCGVTIGRYAFVGAGAVVTKEVPDHGLVVGNPARQIGWACTCGERLVEEGNTLHCMVCGFEVKDRQKANPGRQIVPRPLR